MTVSDLAEILESEELDHARLVMAVESGLTDVRSISVRHDDDGTKILIFHSTRGSGKRDAEMEKK